ncbi:hypothetical protein ACFVTX_16770 [Agromyces sp. NPDC058136]|uniref:hypothetical protein n=1 Tax=Agromyces sp. NPDC058136 TaxID=3346354 RepID=UPI0036DB0A29
MGHHKKNDELREGREEQAEQRQSERDEAFVEGEGAVADLGSQDERREEGLGRS